MLSTRSTWLERRPDSSASRQVWGEKPFRMIGTNLGKMCMEPNSVPCYMVRFTLQHRGYKVVGGLHPRG